MEMPARLQDATWETVLLDLVPGWVEKGGTGGQVPVSRIIGVSVLYMLRGSRIKGTGTFIHPFKCLKRA